jgi:aerobic-type carbon monoxide dehydrogenase small subunit (CoxS/CutS family)
MRVLAYSMERLVDILRNQLGLTGTKVGCEQGECGACAVLIDGEIVNSCLVPALHAQGKHITTIEGIEKRIGQAFVSQGGTQCGFCTPGMVVASAKIVKRSSKPSARRIREKISGNLCRCTGYSPIVESILEAFRT